MLPAHHFFADYLKAMGRFDEALAEIEKAQELDPLSLAINTGVGHVLYLSGQYDKAIEQYRRAVELDPGFMVTHVWFGRPYLEKGMFTEAIAELETAVRLSGESTVALAMLGHGLASAGRRDEALQILENLKEKIQEPVRPLLLDRRHLQRVSETGNRRSPGCGRHSRNAPAGWSGPTWSRGSPGYGMTRTLLR